MYKPKRSAFERFKTILIVLLTLSMLLLAGIYIGGAQFSSGTIALKSQPLPEGTVKPGQDAPLRLPVYEKGLLPLSFAAIRYNGEGGGAYGTEQAAEALYAFAASAIHQSLAKDSTLSPATKELYTDATKGDCIYLHLLAPLPYQMLYALTGEATAVAGSDQAINADRLLLSFDESGKAILYLTDGTNYYMANGDVTFKVFELAAMANDSRLENFSFKNAVAVSSASPRAPLLTLQSATVDTIQYNTILSLLGYDTDIGIAAAADAAIPADTIAPHGTVRLTDTSISYIAARDSGISLSDFLTTAKSELDMDMYDVLSASVALCEQIRTIAPKAFGGESTLFLRSFCREDDTFSITFGICQNSIEISGDAYPYFAKLTVQGGFFKSLDIRFLHLSRSAYTGMIFPSVWVYNYASKNASVSSLRLHYPVNTLPTVGLDPNWYFTGDTFEAEVSE